jgi:hypothetical protein
MPMPDPSGPRLAIICRACGYPSSAYVAGKITSDDEDEDGPFELSLIRCEFCRSPSLVRQDEASEAAPVEVWPTSRRTLDEGIPRKVRDGVIEARKCFEAGAFLATAVMVRRAIEGFCAENGAVHKVLHRSIQELVQRGVIDGRLLEWADGLRILGNAGAHFTEHAVTKQDASDALDLIEAMLDYVYVFSAKFEQFKSRRAPGNAPRPRPRIIDGNEARPINDMTPS